MKKYQVTWGWEPPKYEKRSNNCFRLFYFSDKREKEIVHRDFETGEETTDIVTEWLCDVVEYEKEETKDIFRMLKENPNSLEFQKWLLEAKINAYDKSHHVEDFTIGGIHLWLDSTMRSKVKENLETCQQLGEDYTTLRFDGKAFPITVTMGWQMYYSVLKYARDCWNVTESHLATISKITDIEELKAYDYTTGYPSKLAF